MTIHSIKEELKTANKPVARALDHNDYFKVLVIGFKQGMRLKEHMTKIPAKLTVLEGSVLYQEGTTQLKLNQYDEHEIPLETLHEVEAAEDSLCLLTQGEPIK